MPAEANRVESIFHRARQLPPSERAAFVAAECAGDAEARERVERLLAAHADLEAPLPTVSLGQEQAAPTGDLGPEAAGTLLAGKYKLVEEVGEGGMGSVWMAQQTAPVKRRVAVKLIKAGMDTKSVLAHFEAERQALAMMDHPNIAKVFDAGVTPDGRPFFVMELVKGVPITRFCDERKLTPRERLELFVPVCNAIQHAHQKGVIHRDIKPSNVLVALFDDRPVPKVIDFGVAKAAGQPLTDMTLATGFGAVVGTPEYMSPEQASFNNLDIDTRSDVYALGVLLYELLAGSPPFSRTDLEKVGILEILRVIREQEPHKPSTKLSTAAALPSLSANRGTEPGKLTKLLRGELDWIVMKALEKDRNRRYDSANNFAADVQRYLAGEPVQAVPPTTRYRLQKWLRRNKVAVLTAVIIWLITLTQVGFSTLQWLKAERSRKAEVKQREKAEQLQAEAEERRREADDQRRLAEHRAATVTVDAAIEAMGRTDTREGLLRLAGTLKALPPDARGLREGVVTNLIVWGQQIAPAYKPLPNRLHAVSPDGRVALAAPRETWDARDLITGRLLAKLGGDETAMTTPYHTHRGHWAGFSGDGRVAVTIYTPETAADPSVRVWDTSTWKERFHLRPAKRTHEVRLNRDGTRLATRSDDAPERTNDTAKMRPVLHLWDAGTGKQVATLDHGQDRVEQLVFSPSGDVLMSLSSRAVRLWSAADGRLLHALDKHPDPVTLAAFSPSGKTLAVASGSRVHWWNVADGTPAGVPHDIGFDPHPLDYDEITRFAFETEDVLIVRAWNIHGVVFGRRVGGGVCVRGEPKTYILDAVCSDGKFALTEDRHVYSLSPFRRLETPAGRKFPPEVLAAANGRRYVQVGRELLDLVAEVRVGTDLNGPEADIHPIRAAGFGMLVEGEWSHGRFSGQLLVPSPGLLPPDAVMELWAKVLARGHIDPDSGLFRQDDEATWERNRKALLKQWTPPPGEFPFPGAFASDPLFWLRRAYREAEKAEARLPLIERLVAAEPTWQNHLRRANVYANTARGLDSIREDIRAREMAGDEFESDPDEGGSAAQGAARTIIALRTGPKEEYELALKWHTLVYGPNPTGEIAASMRALALYRLGRPEEGLRVLAAVPGPRAADVVGGLMSPWAALAVGHEHAEVFRKDWRGEATMPYVVAALCLQKLGRPDAARQNLALARELLRERLDEDYLTRWAWGHTSIAEEAVEVVEGKKK